jgi:hypothetical protein
MIAKAVALAVFVLAAAAPLITLDEALADERGPDDATLVVESVVRATVAGDTILEVRASISPARATVGDRLILTLTAVRDYDGALAFPRVAGEIAPFEVLDVMIHATDEHGGAVIEQRQYVLTAFETGDLRVPALAFRYVSPEGDTASVYTDTLIVTIESVISPEELEQGPTARDIKPPLELKRRIWPAVVIAGLVAAVLVGLLHLRRRLRSRRNVDRESETEPEVRRAAAHLAALARLGELERDDLIGQGELSRFYLVLTDVLRRYILDRFSVNAIDMTTKELASAMCVADLAECDVARTVDLLGYADLSKFARHMPTSERAHDDLVAVRAFVERTRFRELSDVGLSDVGLSDPGLSDLGGEE